MVANLVFGLELEVAGPMSVEVKFFASLRDELGSSGCQLAVPSNVAALLASLEAKFGTAAQALSAKGVRVALNQSLVDPDALLATKLKNGDEIAFLPPVTGG